MELANKLKVSDTIHEEDEDNWGTSGIQQNKNVRFDDPYFLYGSEVKAAVPFHPKEWKSRANDIFNLEGGRNRSIRVQDPASV